jgi:ribonuclease BN (tRNA processing enzyme)
MIDDSILFDIGPGALKNFRVSRVPIEQISRVFISHTHADHISDLIPFLWAIQIDGRQKSLEIYGPPGFKQTFRKLLECTSTPDDFFKFPLLVSELEFGEKKNSVSTCRSSHAIPTLAFRIDLDGKSLCYSADTIYCPAVVELARNVDLLLHESTFLQDQEKIAELTYHSTARMAGRAAKEAGAKRLALFHIPPPNDHREDEFRMEATEAYGREVSLGTDLSSMQF